ncbi:unnamed protein product [Rotaria sp. Silwood1]|nr:unnamed protein product [Rotaria sp. Silwood1]CAF1666501.1 unnamed protein product [Rotaria sp. Silwood1]CAF5036153.1 unnamed protein product [Rotaria sp. Silwood1]
MTLELLPNELLLQLFEYLPVVDLFRAFLHLNSRFNNLLFNQFRKYRLNFQSTYKQDFDIICRRYLPSIIDRTISLCLSDDDKTPDQSNCFVSYNLALCDFRHLQSLSLYYLRCEIVMCQLMNECQHLHSLIYLKFSQCKFRHEKTTICCLLSSIWCLPKLTYCYLDIYFNGKEYCILPTMISTSLQHLTIQWATYRLTDLAHIFQCTPYLQYLDANYSIDLDDTPLSFNISSIVTLKMCVYESRSTLISFLEKLPNLRHLTIETDDTHMDGYQWEQLIVNHLPKLQILRLKMLFHVDDNENKEQRVDDLLNSFRTRFWLEEHQWYVRCDWDRCQQDSCRDDIFLYTLPYTFNDYYLHDSIIKEKSTCPGNDIHFSYDQVHSLQYEIFPPTNQISSQFMFLNIHELYMYFPIDVNFWLVMPRLDHLKSLSVGIDDLVQTFDTLCQLQTILDRAPRLYSLTFERWPETFTDMPPFNYSSNSVRLLHLQDIDRPYNHRQCVILSRSSLGKQCEILSITVKYRRSILYLLRKMTNLRALNFISQEDPWADRNQHYSSSSSEDDGTDDELIAWLKDCLPSTYTITRCTEGVTEFGTRTIGYPIRLWIG